MKRERLWVHPSFKKRVKREALEKGKTVVNFTKEIADEELIKTFQPIKKKNGFKFPKI